MKNAAVDPKYRRTTVFVSSLTWVLLLTTVSWASPYPLRVGTQWTYAADDKTETTVLVEILENISVKQGKLSAALLRRSDGTDRWVIRSETRWLECEKLSARKDGPSCESPLLFFVWPLQIGKRWSGGRVDFAIAGQEAITVPYKTFPESWRLTYSLGGERDPIGEMWVVENIGRIRLRENQIDYQLQAFEPGNGPELAAIDESLLDILIREATPAPMAVPRLSPILGVLGWFTELRQRYFYVLVPGSIFVVALLLGLGLAQSMWRRGQEAQLPPDERPDEELKLLAAIARGGDVAQARDRLEEMVRRYPTYPDLRHQLALLYQAEGHLDGARQNWLEAIRLNSRYAEARLAFAQLLSGLREYPAAAEQFRAVVEQQPHFADAWIGLGKALTAMGELGGARSAFERAIAINPALEKSLPAA